MPIISQQVGHAATGRQQANASTGIPVLTKGVSLATIDAVRKRANKLLDPRNKSALGQFMTPSPVAGFMASLFAERSGHIRMLDAGAGVGSLSVAFLQRFGTQDTAVTAYEIDTVLREFLTESLSSFEGLRFTSEVIGRDFIQDAVIRLKVGDGRNLFTHAIMNPPYKKISSASQHRELLKRVGLETVNLYSAFVGLALSLMAPGGELAAIIPRSFCNGLYYKPFRLWILERAAIEHIHLFESRTSAFAEDSVLQENVIVKFVRGATQRAVTVSTSSDTTFADLRSHVHDFAQIVHFNDLERFIRIPTVSSHGGLSPVPMAAYSLSDLGVKVSTGPVVDFRLKEHLRHAPEASCVPLLYPVHFSNGTLEWPKDSRKPNALVDTAETRKWMYSKGCYTVVRRFSSKEETRRIVANVVRSNAFSTDHVAFENHLNVFHAGRIGLDENFAFGLCAFLNSTAVDDYFRRFSGHTQVNATDLRLLRYPSRAQLIAIGEWYRTAGHVDQFHLDAYLNSQNASS